MEEYSVIEKLIYFEKKYDDAVEMLNISPQRDSFDFRKLLAETLFYKQDFCSAIKIYEEINENFAVGYCYLLLNKIDLAIDFLKESPISPAQNWGLFFSELFRARVNVKPSYLQIRAFLERDLNLFLKLDLISHVQKIIDISDYLAQINPETNKYIARAFLFNDYPDYAKEYLDRAFEFTSHDAELHYLLAKYNLAVNLKDKAIENLEESLRISDTYVPAKILLDKLF